MEIWDWKDERESEGLGELRISCVTMSGAMDYLQLWGEYGFKLQAQSVLAVSQYRWRPLLVTAQALQRLLSSLSGLEPVHHLTRQEIGALITPSKGLKTQVLREIIQILKFDIKNIKRKSHLKKCNICLRCDICENQNISETKTEQLRIFLNFYLFIYFLLQLFRVCMRNVIECMCWHFSYPLKAEQQVSSSSERGPLGAYGSGDDITVMPQLVAALDDECEGVVVVGGQLVTVQDHHLGTSHLLLIHKHTHTERF